VTKCDRAATNTHEARQVTTTEDKVETKPTQTLRPKGYNKNGTVPADHEAQPPLRKDRHISKKNMNPKSRPTTREN
jgi:hypothetical protein